MRNFLKRLFAKPPRALICGGDGCVSVQDRLNREVGRLYYRRPTSDELLEYVYAEQALLGSETKLRELSATDAKMQVQKIHEILCRDLLMPRAEKIFVRSELYVDERHNPIESFSPPEQLAYIKKYYAHQLTDMCLIAFQREGSVKKKF